MCRIFKMIKSKKILYQRKLQETSQNFTFSESNKVSLLVGFASVLIISFLFYTLGSKQFLNNIFTKQVSKEKIEEFAVKGVCDEEQSIKRVKDSIVKVTGDQNEGTGFIIREEGYILTNYHLVKTNNLPRIVLPDNTPVAGKLFNWDEQSNLAIIKIDRSNLKPLQFAEPDKLQPEEEVYALSYSSDQKILNETVKKGIYLAVIPSSITGIEYLKINANLNKKNSGSPVIDSCGNIVGIVAPSVQQSEKLSFAVSAKSARSFADSLINAGSRNMYVYISDPEIMVNTVAQFYNYLSGRQTDLAYGLFSNNFKKIAKNYADFAKGYDSTLNIYLMDIRFVDQSMNSVYVRVAASDYTNGEKVMFKTFEGIWTLIQEDGIWKLDSANISQSPS